MNFSEMIKSSPLYRSMLEQVPESERALVEEQLASILQHYSTITAALPGDSMTELSRVMSTDEPSSSIDTKGASSAKRAPKRF